MIDEGVESGWRVDIDLGDPPIEKMLQGAARLVFRENEPLTLTSNGGEQ